jgi:hypothetical protein
MFIETVPNGGPKRIEFVRQSTLPEDSGFLSRYRENMKCVEIKESLYFILSALDIKHI